jgi:alkylation response protein AidB-like acyl-CoA dehydrogenase
MDLQFSTENDAFAAEVRDWLTSRLEGDFAAVRHKGAPGREHEAVEERIAWEQELGKAGFIGIAWPKEVGGLELSLGRQLIFWDEYVRAGGPGRIGVVGDWLLGPTLIAHGTVAQQRQFLPQILDGTVRWCQGYSEPDAGSDLASLRTRAERDGDEWVIEGHKVWTSLAHLAHWNFVLCRTGAPGSRHRGISYLLVPMDQDGIEVRPIRDITGGDSDFCEVFYRGARTAVGNVVGGVDGGWQVAMSTVTLERGLSTVGYQLSFEQELRAITDLARANGANRDPVTRQRLATAWIKMRILRYNLLRTLSSLEFGATAPVTNVFKLFWGSFHQELGELAMQVAGPEAQLARAGPHSYDALQTLFLYSRAETIYGGSNEIQRNIIGERALGLPPEPKPTRAEP